MAINSQAALAMCKITSCHVSAAGTGLPISSAARSGSAALLSALSNTFVMYAFENPAVAENFDLGVAGQTTDKHDLV
jgi:hypothetical protein